MSDRDARDEQRLRQLGTWRTRPPRDLSLHFLKDQFQREVAKPYKQLGQIVELWREHVPDHLHQRTALRSLQRGRLTVTVSDSSTLYELDRLLRGGVEQTLRRQFPGNLRRVKLEVGPLAPDPG